MADDAAAPMWEVVVEEVHRVKYVFQCDTYTRAEELARMYWDDGNYSTAVEQPDGSHIEGDNESRLTFFAPRRLPDCSGPGLHVGPWERVPGSDSCSRCTACGHVSGK